MIFLSAQGGVTGAVPQDPLTVHVAEPALSFVRKNLDGVRLTYSTAYNTLEPGRVAQLRAHLVPAPPGDPSVPPDSPQAHPFTPGLTYRVLWEKVGGTVTVEITPPTGVPQRHRWTDPAIAAKAGRWVALYQQPYRDATYRNITIWERAPA